jgi:hypothetical protein
VPAIQVTDLPNSNGKVALILQGNDLIGVHEFTPSYLDLHTRGGEDLVPRAQSEIVSEAPAPSVDEGNGVSVRAFPLLHAPQKATVGVGFDLEIGLSVAPVVGVTSLRRGCRELGIAGFAD